MATEYKSLKEILEEGNITHKGNNIPKKHRKNIKEHGGNFKVSPLDVTFNLRNGYQFEPDKDLEHIQLSGDFSISSGQLIISMGDRNYLLNVNERNNSHRKPLVYIENKLY